MGVCQGMNYKFQQHLTVYYKTYLEYMIPDRSTAKIYVEVCEAISYSHQAVFLDLWLRVGAVIRKLVRPYTITYPANISHTVRHFHKL